MSETPPPEASDARGLSFGIAPPNFGPFGDPAAAAELAATAEEAGWDGYFCWDSLPMGPEPPPAYDPWVILSAVAVATARIRVGTCIAVVPRYHPHLLARTLVSLDVLSNGRLILGVGIGGDDGASAEAFGEAGDARVRAEKLDEALDIVTRLWAGEELSHRGPHYTVDGFTLAARPVQTPRIPIWVGGDSPPALRRAARWDGWVGPNNPANATVDDLKQVRRRLAAAGAGPDVQLAWAGPTNTEESLAEFQEAGASWWVVPALGSREQVLDRVAAGPRSLRTTG